MPDHEEAVREARRLAIESLTYTTHHGSCKANHERVRDHGDCDCGEWGDAAVLIDAVAAVLIDAVAATARASERARYAALVEAATAAVTTLRVEAFAEVRAALAALSEEEPR